jgi:hypothetical protein
VFIVYIVPAVTAPIISNTNIFSLKFSVVNLYCNTLRTDGHYIPVIDICVYDFRHVGHMLPKIAVI